MFSKSKGRGVEYSKLVDAIAIEKREVLSDKLVDLILTSKNDDKMPSQLANTILNHWQTGVLATKAGLATLLEAAVLLEPEKTIAALTELQLTNTVEQIKEAVMKT